MRLTRRTRIFSCLHPAAEVKSACRMDMRKSATPCGAAVDSGVWSGTSLTRLITLGSSDRLACHSSYFLAARSALNRRKDGCYGDWESPLGCSLFPFQQASLPVGLGRR